MPRLSRLLPAAALLAALGIAAAALVGTREPAAHPTPLTAQEANMPDTPAGQPLVFQHRVTGERVTLTKEGSQVIRTVDGQRQPVSPEDYAARLSAEAELQAERLRSEDFYSPMTLAQYRLELFAEGGSTPAAQKLWQERGLSLRLWEELDELGRGPLALLLGMGAVPLDGGPNFNPSVFMSEMAYSGSIQMSEDGQSFEVERNGQRQTIPIPEDSLLFHPPAELRERFNQMYGERLLAEMTVPHVSLLDDTARQLQEQGYLRVLPRRADGQPALPAQLEPYRAELTADERPVVRLRPVKVVSGETLPLWASRLGGVPYRPHGEAWPLGHDGKPMSFLAQLNLAELNADGHLPDLPTAGMLQFFMGPEHPDESCVIYRPEVSHDSAGLEQTAPAPGEYDWLTDMLSPGEWGWQAVEDTDVPSGIAMNNRGFRERYSELPDEVWSTYVNEHIPPGSRLGGHAMIIYDDWSPEERWVNLFQLDGDALDMGGWLTFRILEDDLRRLDFSAVVLVADAF